MEITAEWWNEHLRKVWGLDDPDDAAVEYVWDPDLGYVMRRKEVPDDGR